jgi:hypothetical protein
VEWPAVRLRWDLSDCPIRLLSLIVPATPPPQPPTAELYSEGA